MDSELMGYLLLAFAAMHPVLSASIVLLLGMAALLSVGRIFEAISNWEPKTTPKHRALMMMGWLASIWGIYLIGVAK